MNPAPSRSAPFLPLQALPTAGRGLVLVAASLALGGTLQWAGLPAAPMLGPMAAAVLVQAGGGTVKIPRPLVAAAQAVIGCLVASSITSSILFGFVHHWPIILGTVALSITAGLAIGWSMSRFRVIPGSTAVWGMLPGTATVMMMMAEAHGADFRLVAFMQYLRVVFVAATASVVALLFTHGGGGRFAAGLFPAIDWQSAAATAVLALVGGLLARTARIRGGAVLGPLALGAVLNAMGLIRIELPPTVLIASYTLVGWNTGLRFTPDVLTAAARALAQSVGAALLLIAFCGLLAWLLVILLHVDALTAYLATSPGGVDAAMIIAASSKVDTPFVMALQTVRMIMVLLIGPSLARFVAGLLGKDSLRCDDLAADPGDSG